MNNWNMNKFWLLISLLSLFTLFSCDKEEETNEDVIAKMQKNKEDGEHFLKALKSIEGVICDDRGLLFRVDSEGVGSKPDDNDSVCIAYVGKRIDGKVFETVDTQVGMNELMDGLYIGVRYMNQGAKHTLYLPYYLMYGASSKTFYGESDTVTVEAYSALVYEMELKRVIKVD